jgi:hypothetical protein
MFAVVAAGLAQPHPAVTLAGATLREDEAGTGDNFRKSINLFFNFTLP